MKQELSIQAVHTPGDGLLNRLTEVLRDASRPPECLVWSNLEGTGEVRVWITLVESEAKFQELARGFSRIPGVQRVLLHGPGVAILAALYSARSPSPTEP